MRIRALLVGVLLAFNPFWGFTLAQEESLPEAAAHIEEPETAGPSDECRPAEARPVPGAVVIIPGNVCPNLDITDPGFSPFRPIVPGQ